MPTQTTATSTTVQVKKVLATPSRMVEPIGDFCPRTPDFQPLTTWGAHYQDAKLIGISWQGEPILTLSGVIIDDSEDDTTVIHGITIFKDEDLEFLKLHFGSMVLDDIALKLNYHSSCSWDGESRTVARSCRQKADRTGQKQDGIFCPPAKQAKVGNEVTILVVPKGDTRQGYEEALGYYLVK